jgi:hypothetical protein
MNMDGNTFIALLQSRESGSAHHAELSRSNDREASELIQVSKRPQRLSKLSKQRNRKTIARPKR